jgi:hypothetical protein
MSDGANEPLDISKGGLVCIHLLAIAQTVPHRHYTGNGVGYNLFCAQCRAKMESLASRLHLVSQERFKEFDQYCESMSGQPEVFSRETTLHFVHEDIILQDTLSGKILSIVPQIDTAVSQWMAVLSSAEIVRISTSDGSVTKVAEIPPDVLPLADKVALHLAPNSQYAAVVNDRESRGVVLDLSSGAVTMRLDRGSYYPEQTPFPAAFFELDERILLVHGTKWKRLDVSDPKTGRLVTDRMLPNLSKYRVGKPIPKHYLDYFHSRPVISPNAEWIAEDGWTWHPIGQTRLWNLRRWVTQNVWESEDGDSLQDFNWRFYHWDVPLCWIDNKTLAVWGHGNDDDFMIPAVQIFDAETGNRLHWFAGPKRGALYFDDYLIATSTDGTEVWDTQSGERLLHDAELTPINFHPKTHEFLSILTDASFRLSRLVE